MESKVNLIRGRSSFVAENLPAGAEIELYPASVESFCGLRSYYANQDVFCSLKPKPVPENKQPYKIYTKEL